MSNNIRIGTGGVYVIDKSIIDLVVDAAHMQRWNDYMRPGNGFTELDKQAHKMFYAYVLGRFSETDGKTEVNWRALIEGSLFEFLHRIVLTDIKPPILHKLMEQRGEKMNKWVLQQLEDILSTVGNDFSSKFEKYIFDSCFWQREKKILKAAHYMATGWEFKIIHDLNRTLYGIEETKSKIENELEEHCELIGVQKILLKKKTYDFLNLVGQLRFQQRWAQSPRLPETSVMGHMLIVAMFGYFFSIKLNACDMRICNNYLAGLFHDLGEVMTRDIISPVKRSIEGLDDLIREIEDIQINEKILPLLPVTWHKQIKYFIEDEFENKVIKGGNIEHVSLEEINSKYNIDKYSPVDGELLKVADHLAAYVEAYRSKTHGITSRHLEEGIGTIYEKYRGKTIAGMNIGKLFEQFHI